MNLNLVLGVLAIIATVATVIALLIPKQDEYLKINNVASTFEEASNIATRMNLANRLSTYRGHPLSEYYYGGPKNPLRGTSAYTELQQRISKRAKLAKHK